MKKIKRFLQIVVLSFVIMTVLGTTPITFLQPLTVEAHSGRTDSSGGHHDNKNKSGLGSYHYHCGGYPAHLHKNGVCPYANSNVDDVYTSNSNTTTTTATTNITTSINEQNSNLDYSKVFNALYYYNAYKDLQDSIGYNEEELLNHFINYGISEGRQACESFNITKYKSNYSDLNSAFGDDLISYVNHYITNGYAEGRIAN